MEELKRLFGHLLKDLSPGLPNPSEVVRNRILYCSAEREKNLGSDGDDMGIDRGEKNMSLKTPMDKRRRGKTKETDMFKSPSFDVEEMAVDSGKRREPFETRKPPTASKAEGKLTTDSLEDEEKKKKDDMPMPIEKPEEEKAEESKSEEEEIEDGLSDLMEMVM